MKKVPNATYTLEFKLEALRRVRGGEPVRKVARCPKNRWKVISKYPQV